MAERLDTDGVHGYRGLLAAWAVTACIAVTSLSGDRPQAPTLIITAFDGGAGPRYDSARTEWGDPDLQGTWTADALRLVPLERHPGLGRRRYVSDNELADRASKMHSERNQDGVFADQDIWQEVGQRTWRQSSLVVDPPDGRIPQVTAAARTRTATRARKSFRGGTFDSPDDFTLNDRCITRGIVGAMLPAPYGNGHRILQAPGMVVLTSEMIHATRVIYTDGRPHIGGALRQYLGDSRGRWEGETLVVTTTNLTDKTSIGPNGVGRNHSAELVLTERIRRVSADLLQYQVTVDDPGTYERGFTLSLPLVASEGQLLPYECHEGNRSLANALRGARMRDRASETSRNEDGAEGGSSRKLP